MRERGCRGAENGRYANRETAPMFPVVFVPAVEYIREGDTLWVTVQESERGLRAASLRLP